MLIDLIWAQVEQLSPIMQQLLNSPWELKDVDVLQFSYQLSHSVVDDNVLAFSGL